MTDQDEWLSGVAGVQCSECYRTTIVRSVADDFDGEHWICRPCWIGDGDEDLDFPLTCQNPNCRFDDAPAAHLVTTRQPCGHNDELLACASCYIDATFHPVLEVTCAECGLTYIAQTADLFTTQPIPTTTRSNP